MKTLVKLEKTFIGKGEVKGFKFELLKESDTAYLFSVDSLYFEVFKKRKTPICIDFDKRIFSDTEFKEIYPKSNSFGTWAFTFRKLEEALVKFNSM